MNHPDDQRNESGHMRYFTPELFLQLNSEEADIVDQAAGRWEEAIAAYNQSLKKIRRELPSETRPIAELSLHDWDLIGSRTNHAGAPSLLMAMKNDNELVILSYALSGRLKLTPSPKQWTMSKEQVHWLYDELDRVEHGGFIHRILFSDGTTLMIPFSTCAVFQERLDDAMSHAELMQIA